MTLRRVLAAAMAAAWVALMPVWPLPVQWAGGGVGAAVVVAWLAEPWLARRRRRWSTAELAALPPAPRDVRALTVAGDVIPVELVYDGLDRGAHVWRATHPLPVRRVILGCPLPDDTRIELTLPPL